MSTYWNSLLARAQPPAEARGGLRPRPRPPLPAGPPAPLDEGLPAENQALPPNRGPVSQRLEARAAQAPSRPAASELAGLDRPPDAAPRPRPAEQAAAPHILMEEEARPRAARIDSAPIEGAPPASQVARRKPVQAELTATAQATLAPAAAAPTLAGPAALAPLASTHLPASGRPLARVTLEPGRFVEPPPTSAPRAPDGPATVQVHISRVEVRATLPAGNGQPAGRPERHNPEPPLSEYLQRRWRGGR